MNRYYCFYRDISLLSNLLLPRAAVTILYDLSCFTQDFQFFETIQDLVYKLLKGTSTSEVPPIGPPFLPLAAPLFMGIHFFQQMESVLLGITEGQWNFQTGAYVLADKLLMSWVPTSTHWLVDLASTKRWFEVITTSKSGLYHVLSHF